jgi:hypothetical protein
LKKGADIEKNTLLAKKTRETFNFPNIQNFSTLRNVRGVTPLQMLQQRESKGEDSRLSMNLNKSRNHLLKPIETL